MGSGPRHTTSAVASPVASPVASTAASSRRWTAAVATTLLLCVPAAAVATGVVAPAVGDALTPTSTAHAEAPPTLGESTIADATTTRANTQTKRRSGQRITGPRAVAPRTRYTVTATVPVKKSTKRVVTVQVKQKAGWRTVRKVRVGRAARVTVVHRASKSLGSVKHRVVASRTKSRKAFTSATLTVKVVRPAAVPQPTAPTAPKAPDTTAAPTPKPTATPTPTTSPTPTPTSTPTPTPNPGWDPSEDTSTESALGSASDWTWMGTQDGKPLGWSTCRPITWSYDATGSYAGSTADLRRSFARVAGISGLRFKEISTGTPDITVGWKPRSSFEDNVLGTATTSFHLGTTAHRIAKATIVFNLDATFTPGVVPAPGMTVAGQVFQHEIMHAVGLGHAGANLQMMYPYITATAPTFGAGDRAGLVRAGSLHTTC